MNAGSSDNPDPYSAKKVDESWKDQVRGEKAAPSAEPEKTGVIEPNFIQFISSLGMQALVFLGEAVLSEEAKPSVDLVQARYLIDILRMLGDKTKGNLTAEETQMLEVLLYELQLKFVERSGIIKP